jgi:hypothetical protein
MEEDEDVYCECSECPACGGFEWYCSAEHGDVCGCSDEEIAEARERLEAGESQE